MFVCICKQVTDRQIKEAVNNGASSFTDMQTELGVATQCGECKNHARQCMRDCRSQYNSNVITRNNSSTEANAKTT
jgi:bacterioferritin-associated ferredoxin